MSEPLEHQAVGPLRIAYRRRGFGRPLVMLHGAEGDHRIYDRLQDEIGDRMLTLSFDQRDCGATRHEGPGQAEGYILEEVAEDAVRLMDGLGIEAADLLGNSIGRQLAQIIAVRRPERVRRLVLGLPWPADDRLRDLKPAALAGRAEYAARGAEGERPMVEMMAGPTYVAAHPEILEELRSLRTNPPAEARRRREAAFTGFAGVDPSRIRQPTLVIGGGADQMVPADLAGRLAHRIPGASFLLLPDAGHLAVRQQPREFAAAVVEFLDA